MMFGLFADAINDVRTFHGLLPLIFMGQFVLALLVYLGKLWALIGITVFVTVAFVDQIMQTIKLGFDLLPVIVPFMGLYVLLAVIWFKNKAFFSLL